jgi:hypothetical protein
MTGLPEIFPLLVLIKMGTAVLVVVGLSVLAESVSTRFAGILSGYPLGAALSLFFMGYEISPQFASESARYTCLGLIATLFFVYFYYQASLQLLRRARWVQVAWGSVGGLAGYFLAAWLVQGLPVSVLAAVSLPSAVIPVFHYLLRNVAESKIQNRIPVSLKLLSCRALFAGCAIVVVTSTAGAVGPGWAGVFAAFPITMLPLLMIIHFTYGVEHVHAILKQVPKGLGALVAYALAVSFWYPVYGILAGTVLAYCLASLYLVATHAGEWLARGERMRRAGVTNRRVFPSGR